MEFICDLQRSKHLTIPLRPTFQNGPKHLNYERKLFLFYFCAPDHASPNKLNQKIIFFM